MAAILTEIGKYSVFQDKVYTYEIIFFGISIFFNSLKNARALKDVRFFVFFGFRVPTVTSKCCLGRSFSPYSTPIRPSPNKCYKISGTCLLSSS